VSLGSSASSISRSRSHRSGALDTGAHGVLVPLLYTAEDAKKLVAAAKFPPVGQRGFGSPFAMERFHPGLGAGDYLEQANDALLTIVQIETKEALENVEAIAAVPGVDVLFVGPYDLGNNIGYPMINGQMHQGLRAAVSKIVRTARGAGKKSGIFCTSGVQAKTYADMGFNMISVAYDAVALPAYMTDELRKAKSGPEDGVHMLGGYS
jgi:4-hydroxy-2-oxoheptanedioate aldolase